MTLSKKAYQWIFIATVFVLCIALIASITIIVKKNNYIKKIKAEISTNETLIENENDKYNELKKQLEQSQQENSDIKKQLEESENAKKKLEEENSSLKKTIEQLRQEKSQSQIGTGEKVCYLTFDDGPSPVTLRILDILKKYNVKATFFVVNTDYISYVSNIHNAGHTVGLHSNTHIMESVYSSVENYFADLTSISNAVKTYTGVESKIIRFPGGSSNTTSKKYTPGIMTTLVQEVQNRGYFYFDWNVSSGDANGNNINKNVLIKNVLEQAKNKNSICVLMHDNGGKSTTADALPEIIEGLSAMNFRFEALTTESKGYHHSVKN